MADSLIQVGVKFDGSQCKPECVRQPPLLRRRSARSNAWTAAVCAWRAFSINAAQAEQLTQLFSGLAQVAIKAAHDALGQEITPESVLKLMPVATPLETAPA